MAENRHDRPLSELFGDLIQATTSLVRSELALARAEISEKVSQAGIGMAFLIAGGALAFLGLLVLLDALVMALATALDISPALSALIVGVVVVVIGVLLMLKGRSDLKIGGLMPERTVNALRRDTQLAKEQ